MPLIGRLLKTTTALSYRKNARKTLGYKHQLDVLSYLLLKSKSTKFGIYHRFQEVLNTSNQLKKFQKNVPVTSYDEFYEKWLKLSTKIYLGHKNNSLLCFQCIAGLIPSQLYYSTEGLAK